MNQWTGIGNVGSDPTLRHTGSGKAVLNFSIAVDHFVVVETPEGTIKKREPDWIPVVVFGDSAEHQAKYLQKGTKVAVAGSLRQRTWIDKAGIARNSFEIQASQIEWLDNVKGSVRKATNDSSTSMSAD